MLDFATTNAREQALEAIGGFSPIRSETLLAFCRMCKVWDDVSRECLKDECPVEKLPIAAQRLLDAWDAKTPLAWQPENNRVLLENLREALHPANNAVSGGAERRTLDGLVGSSGVPK